jgi:hypothetical protein
MGDALKAILADTEAQRERLKTLANCRETELTKLAEVSTNMRDGTKLLVEYVETMQGLASSLSSATGELATTAGELVHLRSDLRNSLEAFAGHTATWTDGIVESWDRTQSEQLAKLSEEFDLSLKGLSHRLQAEVVEPLLTSPVLETSARRIEQLNGAVARLDAIMGDVHQDAAVLGASLNGLARTFGGDLVEPKIVIGETDGAWLEDPPRKR